MNIDGGMKEVCTYELMEEGIVEPAFCTTSFSFFVYISDSLKIKRIDLTMVSITSLNEQQ